MIKDTKSSSKRLGRLIIGYCLIVFGILGGFLPILQGWIFIVLGLLLLKDHARWARILSIKMRKKYPQSRQILKKITASLESWLTKIGLSK